MKGKPLTVRRCPSQVHKALKKSAKANHRSINGETLAWLEEQSKKRKFTTCGEAAKILREAYKLLTPREHREMADDIEAYSKKVRSELFRPA
jgi:hypothetical protein